MTENERKKLEMDMRRFRTRVIALLASMATIIVVAILMNHFSKHAIRPESAVIRSAEPETGLADR